MTTCGQIIISQYHVNTARETVELEDNDRLAYAVKLVLEYMMSLSFKNGDVVLVMTVHALSQF